MRTTFNDVQFAVFFVIKHIFNEYVTSSFSLS